MRIDQTGHPTPLAGGARSTRRQAKTGFALPADAEQPSEQAPAESGPVAAPAASEAIGLLIASEAAPQPLPVDDEAASRQGSALLQAMAGLQRTLLEGSGPTSRQAAHHSLEALAKTLPKAADPALDAVLQAIAQRAAVERARSE